MKKYLETLIDEKGLSNKVIEFEDENGLNVMPIQCVIEFVCQLPIEIKNKIRKTFVMIDFANGDVMDYFLFLAKGISRV